MASFPSNTTSHALLETYKRLALCGGIRRVSPILFVPKGHSRHDCASANNPATDAKGSARGLRRLRLWTGVCELPLTLAALMHGDFPHSEETGTLEKLLGRALRSRAYNAPQVKCNYVGRNVGRCPNVQIDDIADVLCTRNKIL